MVLKNSRQRAAIKAFLMTRKDHPTADMVYANVREEFPNISLGTVYRNLTLLADIGEISRLHFGNDTVDHFDANAAPHYHFICNSCGAVEDIDLPISLENSLENKAATVFDGEITGHETYFYGFCHKCKGNHSGPKQS